MRNSSSLTYSLPKPGEVALVEQREEHRPVGVGGDPAHGLVEVPVGAEQVGAEVADDVVLGVAVEHLEDAEGEADRLPLGVLEHRAGRVAGAPPPRAERGGRARRPPS